MNDCIVISELEVFASIGTTESERAVAQRLTLSLELWPAAGFASVGDTLENTIDYAGICDLARRIAAGKARNLLETLAEDLAGALLGTDRLERVQIEVRKYVFPDTKFVAVKIERKREPQ